MHLSDNRRVGTLPYVFAAVSRPEARTAGVARCNAVAREARVSQRAVNGVSFAANSMSLKLRSIGCPLAEPDLAYGRLMRHQ